jgi:Glycerol-3-phosphate dehydrogenase
LNDVRARPESAALPDHATCDVLVVGGGINGAGIARDLAGRGLRVLLCEQDDLAQHTSSASTKLVHGGLRYLEYREFALVRKALAEREVLLRSAPHIMWPLRFVMPHVPAMRPAWLIRAGLFLYDHLARRELLPASQVVDLRHHPAGTALQPQYVRGFVYSDGWVDDARLVLLCAVDAAARGARVLTRWRCADARREAQGWQATLQAMDGTVQQVRARALVNAAGPWAAAFLAQQAHGVRRVLRLVKGSHIVVPRLFGHDHAYVLQNEDRRIIFAIPYEEDFTLIGTTDVELDGPPGPVRIEPSEIQYLCTQASRYLAQPVQPAQVVWTFSGVRPLLDDEAANASAITRDYLLELDTAAAPLLNVWGGKITTFRKLAQEAADRLAPALGCRAGAWTAQAFLPGGDLSEFIGAQALHSRDTQADMRAFDAALARRWPDLPAPVRQRWARLYGARVALLLDDGAAAPQLGTEVAAGLYEVELDYLHRHEWARSAEDVLWRRTKLGLHQTVAEREAVRHWCEQRWRPLPAAPDVTRAEGAWN